jgi:hypothetical protein
VFQGVFAPTTDAWRCRLPTAHLGNGRCNRAQYREENPMIVRWIALLGAATLLAACSAPPTYATDHAEWNGGVWNSVLGYVGPDNARVTGGPSR